MVFISSILLTDFLYTIVPLLLAVAVLTLFERKVMAIIQRRHGPNVVGTFGLLQPFADGIKLVGKQFVLPTNTNKVLFIGGPLFSFAISLTMWSIVPFGERGVFISYFFDNQLTLLLLFGLSSLGVYGIIISGWASNSFYAFLGALRASAQMLSYEVSFALTLLPVVIVSQTFNIRDMVIGQEGGYCNGIMLIPSFAAFFISALAETNRTPFDLPEAEGELVAGFNVEYSAIFFALFFLSEYSNIILMAGITALLFLGGWLYSTFILSFNIVMILTVFIIIRAILPRYRYDQLISLGWKTLLPFTMGYFLFVAGNFYFSTQLF